MKVYAKILDSAFNEGGEPDGKSWTYDTIQFEKPADLELEVFHVNGIRVKWWIADDVNDAIASACKISERMKQEEANELFDAREELIWQWLGNIVKLKGESAS